MKFKNIEDVEYSYFDLDYLINSSKSPDTIVAPNVTTIGISGEEETISESSQKESTIVTPLTDQPVKVYNSNLIEISKNDYLLKNNYLSEYTLKSDKDRIKKNLGISINSNVLELFDENENPILTIDFNKYTSFTLWGIPSNHHRYWWDEENVNDHFTFCDYHDSEALDLYYYDYVIDWNSKIATFNYCYKYGDEGYNKIARIFNEYEAGENISIDGNYINCTLTSGKGITITDNIISSDIAIVELTEEEYLNLTTKEKNTIYNIINTDDYVDLGLPSGTLWATCNVGANNPWEYGNYYAYGETEPKKNYYWTTYKWCNGSNTTLTKYCTNSAYGTVDGKTELDLEDDAAYVNLGSNWKTPNKTLLFELYNNTTSTWTTLNNINGLLITSKINNKSIFLPAAGYYYMYSLYDGTTGIWNLLSTSDWYLGGNSNGLSYLASIAKCDGSPIRPVKTSLTYKYFYLNGNKYESLDEIKESINDLKSFSISTSITSLTPSKLIIANINSSLAFGLATIPEAGLETHVIINNTGSSNITITIPTTGNYVNCGEDTLTISSDPGEINALSDGTKIYLRGL